MISIILWITSSCKWFVMQYFVRSCSSWQIFVHTISHILLKTSLPQFILIDISSVTCFFELLYGSFVFLEWSTSPIPKSLLPQMHFRYELFCSQKEFLNQIIHFYKFRIKYDPKMESCSKEFRILYQSTIRLLLAL